MKRPLGTIEVNPDCLIGVRVTADLMNDLAALIDSFIEERILGVLPSLAKMDVRPGVILAAVAQRMTIASTTLDELAAEVRGG